MRFIASPSNRPTKISARSAAKNETSAEVPAFSAALAAETLRIASAQTASQRPLGRRALVI